MKILKKFIVVCLVFTIVLSSNVKTQAAAKTEDVSKTLSRWIFTEKEVKKSKDEIESMDVYVDDKNTSTLVNGDDDSIMVYSSSSSGSKATTIIGTYPTRKGVILITNDSYFGIPTGHSAIIYSKNSVVEATDGGVVMGKNNWYSAKKTCYAATCKKTTLVQDKAVADWCQKQLNKDYNYNYFNIKTRSKFYCAQLVYAGFLDLYNINLNTSAFSTIFGNPIHPVELVANDNVNCIYKQY